VAFTLFVKNPFALLGSEDQSVSPACVNMMRLVRSIDWARLTRARPYPTALSAANLDRGQLGYG